MRTAGRALLFACVGFLMGAAVTVGFFAGDIELFGNDDLPGKAPESVVTSNYEATQPPTNASDEQPPALSSDALPVRSDEPADQSARPVLTGKVLTIPVIGVKRDALVDSFGDPRGGGTRSHEGIDIMAAAGTAVLAVADGKISDIFDSDAGGLTLTLRGAEAAYFYGHLSAYAPGLKEGQTVHAGQKLGAVGSTGNADASAPHLHFEMRLLDPGQRWNEGAIVTPYNYFVVR